MSKPNQNVIKSDLTDRLFFKDIAQESNKVRNLCATDPATDLCQDVFSSLYRYQPEVLPEAPAPQKQMIEQMMSLPEYKSLVGDTRGDELSSAMGLTNLAPKMLQQLEKVQKEIEKKQQEQDENGNQNQEPVGFDDLDQETQSSLRAGMRESLKSAQEEGEQTKQMLLGWGAEPGELKKMPLGDQMKLVEQLRNTPKFGQITELVGRFKNVASATQATSFHHGEDEIVDIEMGNDISRLLPSEMLKFQRTPTLFLKDYVEGTLQQYQMRGTENLGRGPIVTLFDVSPSMEYSGAHTWCKAATLTLMEVCRAQKRAFGAIAFEAKVVYSQFWTKGERPTIQDKMEIAQMGTTGGTEFMKPLMEAFRMRSLESDLKPADFVFITDGACSLTSEQYAQILELKEKTSVRIFGIGIGSGSLESIRPFCDDLVLLERTGAVHRMKEIEKLMGAVTAR